MESPTPTSHAATRRAHRLLRNEAVHQRFSERYEQQRERFDDVIAALAAEFFLSPRSIHRILKSPPIGEATMPLRRGQISSTATDPDLGSLE
jgi:hypothetical protein